MADSEGTKFARKVPASHRPSDLAVIGVDAILRPHNLGWYIGDGKIVITTAKIDSERHAGINRLRQTLPKLERVTVSW